MGAEGATATATGATSAPVRERARILLLLDAPGDRRVIAGWLSRSHDVVQATSPEALDEEFDLCVFDDAAFLRLWARLGGRKRRSEPVFLPFVRLTCSRTAHLVAGLPRHDVDEVLEAPIAPNVLVNRIDVLLERRRHEQRLNQEREQAMTELLVARETAERELRTSRSLLEAARIISKAIDVKGVLQALTAVISTATGRSRVVVSLYDPNRHELVIKITSGSPALPLGTRMQIGGLSPGIRRSIAERRPVAVDYEAGDVSEVNVATAPALDARIVLSVPIMLGNRAIGHIGVDEPNVHREFSDTEIQVVQGVASQAAVAIENARLYEERERQAELAGALNRINEVVHSTLDFDTIMQDVVIETTTATELDAIAVQMREECGWKFPYSHGLPEELRTSCLEDSEIPVSASVLNTGRPLLVDGACSDPQGNAEFVERFDVGALIAIPLFVRGEVLGVLLGVRFGGDDDRIGGEQVDFLHKVAATLSLALANARLYQSEHTIAETLQEALLSLPDKVPGIGFAHSYHSAAEAARVGGDFYDLFEIEHDRVGVVIGDVAGKGLGASVLTSLLRNAIRAHAAEANTPGAVLKMTNDLVYRQTSAEAFATVLFGMMDRSDGRMVYANAGHTTALVARADGEVVSLPPNAPLLGAFAEVEFRNSVTTLQLHDVLLLYTDGLIEARRDGELYGESRLFETVAGLTDEEPSEMVRKIVDDVLGYTGRTLADDLALLAIKRLEREERAPAQQRLKLWPS